MRRASLAAALALAACGGPSNVPDGIEPPASAAWSVSMQYGYEGSLALCDLDGDGSLELIAPLTSFFGDLRPDSYVMVLDARSGATRFETGADIGGFAYPFCVDVDDDGVKDVIVAGRSGDLWALSGTDGAALWSMAQRNPGVLAGNTYASAAEAGAFATLFVTAGGGGNPEIDQPDVPGVVVAYDRSGTVLGTYRPPGDPEIYSSPAVVREAGALLVAVGTGGERLRGDLHLLVWDETGAEFTSRWAVPSSCATGGFVASPVFGDLTGDDVPEVVATDFCGRVYAVDLAGTVLWTYDSDVAYGSANALLADLTGDGVLDVVAAFESLNFSSFAETSADPHSRVVALAGLAGTRLWQERMNQLILASPLSADFDGDGTEDVWVLGATLPFEELTPELRVMSGAGGAALYTAAIGNMVGTPVLGDVDADGALDVFVTELPAPRQPGVALRLEFDGVAYDPAASFSGFRGQPDHDGAR